MPRVRWSAAEEEKIAERMLAIFARSPGVSQSSALKQAIEEVLPEDRRRNVQGPSQAQGVMDLVKYGIHKPFSLSDPAPEPAAPEPPPPPPKDMDLHILIESMSGLLEKVLVRVAQRLITNPNFAPMLNSWMNRQMPPAVVDTGPSHRHNPAPPPEGPKKQNVLIVGLKPHNNGFIEAKYGKKLGLKFYYDAGKFTGTATALMEKAKTASRVFMMMEEVGRNHIEACAAAGAHVIRITGGTSALNQAIDQFIESP